MDLFSILNSVTSNVAAALSDWGKTACTAVSTMPEMFNQSAGNAILESFFEAGTQMFGSFFPFYVLLFGPSLFYILVKVVTGFVKAIFSGLGLLVDTFISILCCLYIAFLLQFFLLYELVRVVTGFVKGAFSAVSGHAGTFIATLLALIVYNNGLNSMEVFTQYFDNLTGLLYK